MEVAWVLTWPADYNFAMPRSTSANNRSVEFDANEVYDEEAHLPAAGGKGVDLSGSGIPITCMQCCLYMESPVDGAENDRSSRAHCPNLNRHSSAANGSSVYEPFADLADNFVMKWVVVCGDQQGRVFQFDVTELMAHIRCFDKDAKPNVSTNALAAYQQHAVPNFRDGLDDRNLRRVETLLMRPIGAKSSATNLKLTEILGFRGANISHISRQAMWFAYQGTGVAAISILQKNSNSFPFRLQPSAGGSIVLEPYAFLTASDFGVVRLWSWQGQTLGALTEEELLTHEEYSKSVLSKDTPTILQEGISFLNSQSVDVVNVSNVDNAVLETGFGLNALVEGSKKFSVSQKDSLQINGWHFPEWQISRPNSGSRLPVVVPFSQLPAAFAPRMDLLRDWVISHVKASITSLAEANRLLHNYGDIYVTDGNSTFLEQIHSQMEGGRQTTFATIVSSQIQPLGSPDMKVADKVVVVYILNDKS